MYFEVDKNDKHSLTDQLFNQINIKIVQKDLKPGDKLPTLLEMQRMTGLSVGTIKKVYNQLQEKGLINTIHGSGSYVNYHLNYSEKKYITDKTRELLNHFDNIGLDYINIDSVIKQELNIYFDSKSKLTVACIECCEESLRTVYNQMKDNMFIRIIPILLENIEKDIDLMIHKTDFLMTTMQHYDEVLNSLGGHKKIVTKIAFNLNMESIIDLTKIPIDAKVAIWSVSRNFNKIMENYINRFDNIRRPYKLIGEENLNKSKEIMKAIDYLIVPPEYIDLQMDNMKKVIYDYEMSGGVLIDFGYQLNEGSKISFDDLVLRLYRKKNAREKLQKKKGMTL